MAPVELFRALGDPTRIKIVHRLSNGQSYTLSAVSEGLAISRQAARKHLQVLADANIISLKPVGKETKVQLEHDSLNVGRSFLTEIERNWDKRLEALGKYVERD